MLFRPLASLVTASTASLLFAMDASATSRFTVQNDTDKKVNVYIYSGGDTLCSIEEKMKSVSAGKTDSFGCTGNGKNRCQVQFYAEGNQVCKKQNNSCYKDNSRKLKNGEKAVITHDDENGYYCSFY